MPIRLAAEDGRSANLNVRQREQAANDKQKRIDAETAAAAAVARLAEEHRVSTYSNRMARRRAAEAKQEQHDVEGARALGLALAAAIEVAPCAAHRPYIGVAPPPPKQKEMASQHLAQQQDRRKRVRIGKR